MSLFFVCIKYLLFYSCTIKKIVAWVNVWFSQPVLYHVWLKFKFLLVKLSSLSTCKLVYSVMPNNKLHQIYFSEKQLTGFMPLLSPGWYFYLRLRYNVLKLFFIVCLKQSSLRSSNDHCQVWPSVENNVK